MTNTQELFDEWHDNTYGVKPSFNRNHEGSSHWDGDKQDKWGAWQANQAHNDAVIAAKDMVIDRCESKIAARDEALQGANAVIAELQAEVQHLKANHTHEVERARLLKVRTDLPIERLQAYDRASIDNVNELVVALGQLLIVKDRAGIGGGGPAYEAMRQAAWAHAENVSAKHKEGTA